MALRRRLIQEDARTPVTLGHDLRSVEEQGEVQAAHIDTVNLARINVISEQHTAPVKRSLCPERRPITGAYLVTRARFEVFTAHPPRHNRPPPALNSWS